MNTWSKLAEESCTRMAVWPNSEYNPDPGEHVKMLISALGDRVNAFPDKNEERMKRERMMIRFIILLLFQY